MLAWFFENFFDHSNFLSRDGFNHEVILFFFVLGHWISLHLSISIASIAGGIFVSHNHCQIESRLR